MSEKILYREVSPDGEDSLSIRLHEVDSGGRYLLYREKRSGRYFRDRVIDAAEAGSVIASRRTRVTDKRSEHYGMLRFPESSVLVNALSEYCATKPSGHWYCYLAQAIHKMISPRHEIVDYAALRAAEGVAA